MGEFTKTAGTRPNVKSHSVFTPLGTKSPKDQVGPEPGAALSGLGCASIPAVIFAHWREALNQAALSPAARAGYAFTDIAS
jgi:hypothetical protein